MKTKLLKRHKPDCFSIRNYTNGKWKTPWSVITGNAVYGSTRTPKASGMERWNILRCNDTECPAEIAFRDNDVLIQLNPGESDL